MATPSADRNLLFGILALQMDYLSRDQLIEAMNAWVLEKHSPLDELLRRRGWLGDEDLVLLRRLVERHIERHGGDVGNSLAAVRLEAALYRSLEQTITPDTGLGPGGEGDTPLGRGEPGLTVVGASPEPSASRYRRLRPLARGGLGEVVVAFDPELKREVALKEIQGQYADHPASRARFVREAEVTGQLEHPGIIPIYGLGTYPDGRPYYAMRLIRGESLHDAVTRFHESDLHPRRDPGERALALRSLLTRFVAVCNAVAYAHSRGVIHRDLKPQNVMLGEFGETLVVDWGLARPVHEPEGDKTQAGQPVVLSPGTGDATAMGDVVGTPAFMAPEQAAGRVDVLGPACDIWALGATLYCIVTGQAPYRGGDALEQATRAVVLPAHQVNHRVPPALAAICARALARWTDERYPSARALAADVECWLADEAVSAYPEPIVGRARRWARRHRPVVAGGVVLLLAAAVGLAGGLYAVGKEQALTAAALESSRDHLRRAVDAEAEARGNLSRAESNYRRATTAEAIARANLQRAEENLRLARRAVDECFGVARDDPRLRRDESVEVRKLLFHKALPFYRDFQAQSPNDPALVRAQANDLFRVAFILAETGRKQEALAGYRQAQAAFARYRALEDSPAARLGLGQTLSNVGLLQMQLGDHRAASTTMAQARELFHRLVLEEVLPGEASREYVTVLGNWGVLLLERGDREEFFRLNQLAEEIVLRWRAAGPGQPQRHEPLAFTLHNRGTYLMDLGRYEAALRALLQARELRLQVARAAPDDLKPELELASTLTNLGVVYDRLGRYEEALRPYQQALLLVERVVESRRSATQPRADRAHTHNNLSATLLQLGKAEAALHHARKSQAAYRQLVARHPQVSDYARKLATAGNNVGNACLHLSRLGEAVVAYRGAQQLFRVLAARHNNAPADLAGVGESSYNLGLCLHLMGHPDGARDAYHVALRGMRGLVAGYPAVLAHRHLLGNVLHSLGLVEAGAGRREEALAALREAKRLRGELLVASPQHPDHRSALAKTAYALGNVLLQGRPSSEARRDHEEARREYEEAGALQRRLVKDYPRPPRYRDDLGRALTNLGNVLLRLDRLEEAVTIYQEAAGVRRGLVKDYPRVGPFRGELANLLYNQGLILRQMGRHVEARTAFSEVIELLGAVGPDARLPVEWRDRLAASHYLRALLWVEQRKYDDALPDWDRAVVLMSGELRRRAQLARAEARARAGRRAGALADGRQLAADPALTSQERYALACALALAAPGREPGAPLPLSERAGEEAARLAVAQLRQAARGGLFRTRGARQRLDAEPDLNPLRERADFRSLVATLPPAP